VFDGLHAGWRLPVINARYRHAANPDGQGPWIVACAEGSKNSAEHGLSVTNCLDVQVQWRIPAVVRADAERQHHCVPMNRNPGRHFCDERFWRFWPPAQAMGLIWPLLPRRWTLEPRIKGPPRARK